MQGCAHLAFALSDPCICDGGAFRGSNWAGPQRQLRWRRCHREARRATTDVEGVIVTVSARRLSSYTGTGIEGRHVAIWASMHQPKLAGGNRSAVAARAEISPVVWEALAADDVFLGMNVSQRDAACLLLMSRGAGSVVLWALTEGRALLPSDPELSSDRLVLVLDRSLA
jgi:hypothetical protein